MKINVRTFRTVTHKNFLRLSLKIAFYLCSGYYAVPFFIKTSLGIYHNFFLTSISFNLDTLFLNWNTTFPAVTVCEIYNGEKIWETSEKYFGTDHDLQLDDFVGEITFFRGTCTTCGNCDNGLHCPKNFTQLTSVFRSKCHELIMNCSYTNTHFECCDEFRPIHTEYGVCFAFNSNQARKVSHVQFANNRATGAGHLKFNALSDIQLHVHPPIEIPLPFSEGVIRETVLLGSVKEIIVNVMEVFNHVSIEPLPLEERRCRFSHEHTDTGREVDLYEFYSFSTCIVECMVKIHFEHCNCTSHVLASAMKSINVCDYHGLVCLTEHYYDMIEERKSCDCMSSCEEPEYDIVFNSADEIGEGAEETDISHVRVALVELPKQVKLICITKSKTDHYQLIKQRYVRRVTKNNLDLIISVGGIAGLFFNASLIRVVEIAFLFIDFKWRLLWTTKSY